MCASQEVYTSAAAGGAFWVMLDATSGQHVGCVGAQRHPDGRCELRRMAVSKESRLVDVFIGHHRLV